MDGEEQPPPGPEAFRSWDEYVFPWPWSDRRAQDNHELLAEIRTELGYPLCDAVIAVAACFNRQDEVILVTNEGFARMHVTYSGRRERLADFESLPTWQDVVCKVVEMDDW